ncbi:MAG: FkbM family methyltransferase [Solirubrobacteraceae bacterium]|nr:FkbM family methyltransferase [Solirubrobacteraceae bacterium]
MSLPRAPWRLFLAPFRVANYRTVLRSFRTFEHSGLVLWRYVSNRGEYPYRVGLRTPTGPIAIELPTYHDLRTANEVFNRRDYAADEVANVVVDLGANIGISALYFLTRDPSCRVWCFEPSPINLPRLRDALAGYGDRVVIDPRAVSDRDGKASFNAEPIGRYSGLLNEEYTEPVVNVIEVETVDINAVLRTILETERQIDVLKIDTEGSEASIIEAIAPSLLSRIREIYVEIDPTHSFDLGPHWTASRTAGVTRLRNLQTPSSKLEAS